MSIISHFVLNQLRCCKVSELRRLCCKASVLCRHDTSPEGHCMCSFICGFDVWHTVRWCIAGES